jgi:hypothetical protein
MIREKQSRLNFDRPILNGTVSTALAKCGRKNCKCHTNPKAMHGPYYRWAGRIKGKLTTKTISKKAAEECQRRIENYHKLQEMIAQLIENSLESAPWIDC